MACVSRAGDGSDAQRQSLLLSAKHAGDVLGLDLWPRRQHYHRVKQLSTGVFSCSCGLVHIHASWFSDSSDQLLVLFI
eukprot:6211229-Pleurochrysis_carterae.AAC.1